MKLGYLNIPKQGFAGGSMQNTYRAHITRSLGFPEFYGDVNLDNSNCPGTFCNDPEQAAVLRVLPDLPKPAYPRIIASDELVQPLDTSCPTGRIAAPCPTTEQVMANIQKSCASLSVSWLTKENLARHWAAHVKGCTYAGKRACPTDWHVARTILICDDPARAEAAVKAKDSPCRAYYSKVAQAAPNSPQVDAMMDACVLHGTLQTVLDELDDIAATSGPFGTLTLVDHEWPNEALAITSLAALANAYAPMLRPKRIAM
jgi:hypothetical protein